MGASKRRPLLGTLVPVEEEPSTASNADQARRGIAEKASKLGDFCLVGSGLELVEDRGGWQMDVGRTCRPSPLEAILQHQLVLAFAPGSMLRVRWV